MKYPPIRYKGCELHHNPKSIRIEENKAYKELSFLYETGQVRELGKKARVITGQGELFGTDCLVRYGELLRLFNGAGSGLLSIGGYLPFYASFVSLDLTQPPLENFLSYRFMFLEDMAALRQENAPLQDTHTVQRGETLWDIACIYGISVETLLACNPGIRRPDVLAPGQKVVLL